MVTVWLAGQGAECGEGAPGPRSSDLGPAVCVWGSRIPRQRQGKTFSATDFALPPREDVTRQPRGHVGRRVRGADG